jgi:hypothetical protein
MLIAEDGWLLFKGIFPNRGSTTATMAQHNDGSILIEAITPVRPN